MPSRQPDRIRRNRDITGPAPGSIAVIAKPIPKYDIHWRAIQEQQKDMFDVEAQTGQKKELLRHVRDEWRNKTDAKMFERKIKRRVEEVLLTQREVLAQKRENLKALLREEDEAYALEMDNAKETPLERDARLRETARHIQEKNLAERLEIAQRHVDDQFLLQSDQYRLHKFRELTKQTAKDRLAAVIFKQQEQEELRAEEAAFAELWKQDCRIKMAREEAEAKKAHRDNLEVADILHKQMCANERKRAILEEDKMADGDMKALQREQFMEEKRLERLKKAEKENDVRRYLDKFCERRNSIKQRWIDEENAMDMQILEKAKQEAEQALSDESVMKRENAREFKMYLDYLRDQKEEEKNKQLQYEKLVEAELKKQNHAKEERERQERMAKEQMRKQISAARVEQIRAREQIMLREKEEMLLLSQKTKALEEAARIKDQEAAAKEKEAVMKYRQELKEQIAFNVEQRKLARQRELEEREALRLAEEQYQQRVKDILSRPPPLNKHPMRCVMDSQRGKFPSQPSSDPQHRCD